MTNAEIDCLIDELADLLMVPANDDDRAFGKYAADQLAHYQTQLSPEQIAEAFRRALRRRLHSRSDTTSQAMRDALPTSPFWPNKS